MIVSFTHKGLENFFYTGSTKGIQAQHASKLEKILSLLNKASSPNDLMPFYKFHQLKGIYNGYYSMRVNGNWRIIFRFTQIKNIELVDYIDYH